MDLFPTILAATGAQKPNGRSLDGMDLMPFLTGQRAPVERTLFWRYKRAEARRKAVRSGDWKYLNDSGKEGLYNLALDEKETQDVMMENPDIARDLRSKLAAWEKEVQAPRLAAFRPGLKEP